MQPLTISEDPRTDPRSHVFLMAVLCCGTASVPVRVRNLSVHGALLEGSNLPSSMMAVSLKRGSLAMAGQVAWSKGQQCGMRFSGPIDVTQWVDRAGPIGQQRIDATIAEFRGGGKPASGHIDRARQRDQDCLADLSEDLRASCERLAGLPGMSVALAEELLKIEAVAQSLQSMSRSLR